MIQTLYTIRYPDGDEPMYTHIAARAQIESENGAHVSAVTKRA
jgi:hypothetical protein